MMYAEESLLLRLRHVGITQKHVYTSTEVQRILGISERSFSRLIDTRTPFNIAGRDPRGLESYRIGNHRRIPHDALLDWWNRNSDTAMIAEASVE